MAKVDKYSIRDLKRDFPTDEAITEFIFDSLHSRKCSCGGTYSILKGRRQFQCSKCRFQIAPTAGTIFHKSPTPLTLWFHAIFVFSNAKSGISAKELERQIGVTYKCAWRMLSQIRKALKQGDRPLSGNVEMDGAYMGGRFRSGKDNAKQSEAIQAKAAVLGAVERGGDVRVEVSPDMTAKSHGDFLGRNVSAQGTNLLTDNTNRLDSVAVGYNRHVVNHRKGEFARGDIHVNNIETFWAHIKRSIRGTYKGVSKKHLQSYLDSFAFHYNNRHSDTERFAVLLGALLRA